MRPAVTGEVWLVGRKGDGLRRGERLASGVRREVGLGILLAAALVLAAGGWTAGLWPGTERAGAQGQPALPTVTVWLVRLDPDWEGEGVLGQVVAEVADEPEEQHIGLMGRAELPQGRGMLFVWPVEQPVNMWMRSTRIPLDMVFADRLGQIVRITRNVPPCPDTEPNCPIYSSGQPVRFVLELPAGDADRMGLKEGDWLLPGEL